MPKFGAWFHDRGDLSLDGQLRLAGDCGFASIRSYSLDYAEQLAPTLRNVGLSLYAGLHVEAEGLLRDWHSQFRPDELRQYHSLGVPLEAICVGNELREFGDDPERRRFTARLSYALANLLHACRGWLDGQGLRTPLTYAMEGIVLDGHGLFHEHVLPLLDACDLLSLNLYPMDTGAWHGPAQFAESEAFLRDARVRRERLLRYELQLRGVLAAAAALGKPVILSETGFPSAVGCEKDGQGLLSPVSDGERYGEALTEMLGVIARADADYARRIRAVYFYEWRDNPYHAKIANVERSPIHCAFGLCDRHGKPKFDLRVLRELAAP